MNFLSDVVTVSGWVALITIGTFAWSYAMAFLLACMIELGLNLNRLVGGDTRER
jgi:hypothetical protein